MIVSPTLQVFTLWLTWVCVRSKAWLAKRAPLRLARLPRTAGRAQRSRRFRSMRAAAPVLLVHAEATKNIIFFPMGPKRRYPMVPAVASPLKRSAQLTIALPSRCRCAASIAFSISSSFISVSESSVSSSSSTNLLRLGLGAPSLPSPPSASLPESATQIRVR